MSQNGEYNIESNWNTTVKSLYSNISTLDII